MRILIVDDEDAARKALKCWLDIKGAFIIDEAVNGKEALEKVKAAEYDIVLLDVTMPVMDGILAYRKLREDPRTRHIPVIFMTARPYEEIIQHVPIGPDEYIEKPYEFEDVQGKIDKIIKPKAKNMI